MQFPNQTEHFAYRQLDSGIHELNIFSTAPEAYTECFDCLDQIFSKSPLDEPLLLLTNLYQFEVQRAADVWRLSRKLLISHPQKRPLYNAVVYNSAGTIAVLITAMSQIASVFGARVYFSPAAEHEKAINWLVERTG